MKEIHIGVEGVRWVLEEKGGKGVEVGKDIEGVGFKSAWAPLTPG